MSSSISPTQASHTRAGQNYCQACGFETRHMFCFKKWGHEIIRCTDCGLGSTVIEPGFNPAEIYSEDYFNGSQRDGYADYTGSEPVLRAEFSRLLRDLSKSGVSSGKLLEIGCAYGYFLAEAQSMFETFGFELCSEAVANCRARGLNVACGAANDELLTAHGPFNVAVMLDVIEHLETPGSMLQMLHRHLQPGGRLIISTGDWGSLLAKVTGRNWRLMTPPQHLYFFTQTAITRMLEHAGFRVLQFSHPFKYVPVSLILFQLLRLAGLRPKRLEVPGWMAAPVNLFDAMRVVAIRE